MNKEELLNAAYDLSGGNLADLSIEQIHRLMTVTQYVTDTCLNELEKRDELYVSEDGLLIVPYMSDYAVETALTRAE